jgi:glycosyltransferase involved in cell wall biosynthesis
MQSLIYLQPMNGYPTAQVHSVQITRTVGELGKYADVLLVVGSLSVEPQQLRAAVRDYYGVEFGPRVRVITMSGQRLQGLSFPLALRKLMAHAPSGAVFYTRSYPMARRLLRYRWMHKRKVFFETHKKMGYLKEDPVADSPYAAIRRRFEERNESLELIQRVYSQADCVFFLHRHSLEVARRDLALRDADELWYGLHGEPPVQDPAEDRDAFVYSGSLEEHKLFVLLMDAIDQVHTDVRVSVYGGDSDQIADLRRRAVGRPCGKRLDFLGWRRPTDLLTQLRRYRFGIALQEGLKVVDYFESGLVPIVPDIPSYRDVLDERHACFFHPDSPEHLAQALDHAVGRARVEPAAIRELCDTYSVECRAEKILAKLR